MGGVLTLAISPDGKSLACLSSTDHLFKAFTTSNLENPPRQFGLPLAFPVLATFNPTSEWVAIGVFGKTIKISKLSTMQLEKTTIRNQVTLGNGRITAMEFHPTNDNLFLTYGNKLEAWTVKDLAGTLTWSKAVPRELKCLLVSADGATLYAASEGELIQYSTDGNDPTSFQGSVSMPLGMVWLEGKTLAVLEQRALSLWNTATRDLKLRIELPAMDSLGPAALHPFGECIAYASGNSIRIESLRITGH